MAKPQEEPVEELDSLTQEEKNIAREVAVKKKFPQVVHSIQIPDTDHFCYLREIDRGTLEMALGFTIKVAGGNAEIIRAGETVLLTCWIDGDEIIKTDPKYFIQACLGAYKLVNTGTGILKKI